VPTVRAMSALYGTRLGRFLRRCATATAPRVCAAVHALVVRGGARRWPIDLVLKHRYDYELVQVPPDRVTGLLRASAWRAVPEGSKLGRLDRLERWIELGSPWKSVRRHPSRNLQGRFLVGGDWDQGIVAFEPLSVFDQLFDEGRAPAETDEYRYLQELIAAGRLAHTHGCTSIAELDRYFEDLIQAYETIRDQGYRTQEELGEDGHDEIRVCIDRSGRFAVVGGGTHRLSIAQKLGVELVPVLVKRVHRDWVGLPAGEPRDRVIARVDEAIRLAAS